MTYQEKLDRIIDEIVRLRQIDPGNPFITLHSDNTNQLLQIEIDDIRMILETLQHKDKILKIDTIKYPKAPENESFYEYVMRQGIKYNLEILEFFHPSPYLSSLVQ